MADTRVSIVRALSYEKDELSGAVTRALSMLGGLEQFVRPGDRVFVKVNHLCPPSPPERAIVTHPALTQEVLEHLLAVTPHVSFGDDVQAEEDPYTLSGYRELARRLDLPLVNLKQRGFSEVACRGEVLGHTYVARAVLEADVIVNLPKLKTHSLTTLTGAVKNLYGVIPGGLRVSYHGRFSRIEEFSHALVDIYATARPQLHVMDAVVGMEGEGPGGGTPRPVGLVLAGADGVAVDAVASAVMGLDPMEVGTTRLAHARGLGTGDLEEIRVVGEPLDKVVGEPFVLPSTTPVRLLGRLPRPVARLFTQQLAPRPTVDSDQCVGCGECARICPVGAATMDGRAARIDRRTCIRCMCCHEVCRYDAVVLRRSAHGQALYSLLQAGRRRLWSR